MRIEISLEMKADFFAFIRVCKTAVRIARCHPDQPPHHLPPRSISCHCSSHPPLFCFLCNFTSPSSAFYVPSKEDSFKTVGSPVGVLNPNEVAVSSSGSSFLLLPVVMDSQADDRDGARKPPRDFHLNLRCNVE